MPDHQKPLIQSVERALDILELIADHERPMKSSAYIQSSGSPFKYSEQYRENSL